MIKLGSKALDTLRAVREKIAAAPLQFFMVDVDRTAEEDSLGCDTVMCIAGWICHLQAEPVPPSTTAAARILYRGPAGDIIDSLFQADFWPPEYRDQYDWEGDTSSLERPFSKRDLVRIQEARVDNAGLACRLLDEIVAEGGIWWAEDPTEDPET